MNLLNFSSRFPDELSCRTHFRKTRQKEGVTCKKCGCQSHYWFENRQQFHCKSCRFRTTLRSGTLLEASKLPYRYWYMAIHLMSATKKPISALEMQSQLGHKRLEPIWFMMHKIRFAMGKCDQSSVLEGMVEMDEAYFETGNKRKTHPLTGKKEKLKRGRGSQRQAGVLVMASTANIDTGKRKKHRPKSTFKFVKMTVLEDFGQNSIAEQVMEKVDKNATAITDQFKGYNPLKNILKKHIIEVVNKKKVGETLPWVHIMISNAKRSLLGIYHSIKKEYLQNYLNEFCYKVNRRHLGDKMFNNLIFSSVNFNF
jgi:transposase-like protein